MNFKQLFLATITTSLITFGCSAEQNEWRSLAPEKTVLLTLPHGKVVIELAPQFSPKHVEQFIKLTQSGHYNGNKFYRVIDGFVAQAGPVDGSNADKSVSTLKIEGDWTVDANWSFTQVQKNDLFSEQVGFKGGFALGYNPSESKAWLLHCPGVIAMARGNEADTASSHFYFTNGQAPRYLDRIMTVFGRVVYGMNHVQAITRTSVIKGDIAIDSKEHTPILAMQMMSDVPELERINIEVKNTEHPAYSEMLAKRRKRPSAFFFKKPPPVLDICQTPVASRVAK